MSHHSPRVLELLESLHEKSVTEMKQIITIGRESLLVDYPFIRNAIADGKFAIVFDTESKGYKGVLRTSHFNEKSSTNEMIITLLIEAMSIPSTVNDGYPVVPSIGLMDTFRVNKIPICLGWMPVHNEMGRSRNSGTRLATVYEDRSFHMFFFRKHTKFNPSYDVIESGLESMRSIIFQILWFLFAVGNVIRFSDIDRHEGNFMWIDTDATERDNFYYKYGDKTWKINSNLSHQKLLVATDFGLSVCCDAQERGLNPQIYRHFTDQRGIGHEELKWKWYLMYGDLLMIFYKAYETLPEHDQFVVGEDGKITETEQYILFRDLFDKICLTMENFSNRYSVGEAITHPFFDSFRHEGPISRKFAFQIPDGQKLKDYRLSLYGSAGSSDPSPI